MRAHKTKIERTMSPEERLRRLGPTVEWFISLEKTLMTSTASELDQLVAKGLYKEGYISVVKSLVVNDCETLHKVKFTSRKSIAECATQQKHDKLRIKNDILIAPTKSEKNIPREIKNSLKVLAAERYIEILLACVEYGNERGFNLIKSVLEDKALKGIMDQVSPSLKVKFASARLDQNRIRIPDWNKCLANYSGKKCELEKLEKQKLETEERLNELEQDEKSNGSQTKKNMFDQDVANTIAKQRQEEIKKLQQKLVEIERQISENTNELDAMQRNFLEAQNGAKEFFMQLCEDQSKESYTWLSLHKEFDSDFDYFTDKQTALETEIELIEKQVVKARSGANQADIGVQDQYGNQLKPLIASLKKQLISVKFEIPDREAKLKGLKESHVNLSDESNLLFEDIQNLKQKLEKDELDLDEFVLETKKLESRKKELEEQLNLLNANHEELSESDDSESNDKLDNSDSNDNNDNSSSNDPLDTCESLLNTIDSVPENDLSESQQNPATLEADRKVELNAKQLREHLQKEYNEVIPALAHMRQVRQGKELEMHYLRNLCEAKRIEFSSKAHIDVNTIEVRHGEINQLADKLSGLENKQKKLQANISVANTLTSSAKKLAEAKNNLQRLHGKLISLNSEQFNEEIKLFGPQIVEKIKAIENLQDTIKACVTNFQVNPESVSTQDLADFEKDLPKVLEQADILKRQVEELSMDLELTVNPNAERSIEEEVLILNNKLKEKRKELAEIKEKQNAWLSELDKINDKNNEKADEDSLRLARMHLDASKPEYSSSSENETMQISGNQPSVPLIKGAHPIQKSASFDVVPSNATNDQENNNNKKPSPRLPAKVASVDSFLSTPKFINMRAKLDEQSPAQSPTSKLKLFTNRLSSLVKKPKNKPKQTQTADLDQNNNNNNNNRDTNNNNNQNSVEVKTKANKSVKERNRSTTFAMGTQQFIDTVGKTTNDLSASMADFMDRDGFNLKNRPPKNEDGDTISATMTLGFIQIPQPDAEDRSSNDTKNENTPTSRETNGKVS